MPAKFGPLALLAVAAAVVAGCASATPEPGTSSGGQTSVSNSTTEMKESSVLTEPTPSGTFTTPPVKPAAPVTLTGTPSAGVEAGCLLLGDYLLIGGPRDLLAGGHPITVTGRPDPTVRSTCQQGIPLVVESAELLAPTTG